MNVAFVQDLNPWIHLGGAQQTDKEILTYGVRRGHEIDLITPENFHEPECDVVVFSNCHVLMYNRGSDMLKIAEKNPYVCFHHDYHCRFRLFFPKKEKCKQCAYLEPWRKLYGGSVIDIWMSPLHREGFLYVMPELAEHPYGLVPSAINPKDYKLKEDVELKPNSVIGVNLFDFKGKSNVLKYATEHPDLLFTFVGGIEGGVVLPKNCQYVGPRKREKLVRLYAENEYLIHLPSSPSPFDRIIPEYLLSNPKGKLITNNLVGALSYPNVIQNGKINREELIRLVSTSPQVFWEKVEAIEIG